MRYSGYLICSASGNVKYRKTQGGAGPREIPVTFSFELPNKLFQKPTIRLNIEVDPHGTVEVTPEMREKTRLNLEKELGIKVELVYKDLDACPQGDIAPLSADTCVRCQGFGTQADGSPCPMCNGTGSVTGKVRHRPLPPVPDSTYGGPK